MEKRDVLKQKINQAIGLAYKFAKRSELHMESRAFKKMSHYLKEAEEICLESSSKDISNRLSEIRKIGYRGEIKSILIRAEGWIGGGSIRVSERLIKKAKSLAESVGINFDAEFGLQLKKLEKKLLQIRH